MCTSSSTTRILELNAAAIASIDHLPVRPMSSGHEGNVNAGPLAAALRVRAPLHPGGARPLVTARSQHQLQRVAEQTETVANLLLEVATVRKVEEADVVHEDHNRRGLGAGLSPVAQLQAPALVARRWMLEESVAQHLVQLVG